MTVGDIQELIRQMQAERGRDLIRDTASGNDRINGREWGRYGSSFCLRVARSSIDTNGNIISSDNPLAGNVVFTPEVFAAAGYDVSSNGSDNYLFTCTNLARYNASGSRAAVSADTEIWIDFGINSDLSSFMNRRDTDTPLTNCVAYINDTAKGRVTYNHDGRVAAHNARMNSQ
jgi:hypothetical protein